MSERGVSFKKHVRRWKHCTDCPIGGLAFKHCFAQGNINASYVFVGEGPGASEDALGIPFVGPSGKLLVKGLGLAGYTRDQWLLTNLVACHPKDPDGRNRAPTPREVQNCAPRLEDLIRIIQPQHIVAVGSVPAAYLLGRVGQFGRLPAIYSKIRHPAWILRQGGIRSEAFADFVDHLKEIKRRSI